MCSLVIFLWGEYKKACEFERTAEKGGEHACAGRVIGGDQKGRLQRSEEVTASACNYAPLCQLGCMIIFQIVRVL